MTSLGLVVGIGPAASIYYYRELARAFNAFSKKPSFVLAHADIGTLRGYLAAGDSIGLAEYLALFIRRLAGAGCDVAAISATTAHLCLPQLSRISPLPIVSLLDSARNGLMSLGLRRVALFGTRQTVESDLFGALRALDVVRPRPCEITKIAEIYAGAVDKFGAGEDDLAALTSIAHQLIRGDGIEAVVIAGTDFSGAFKIHPPDYPYIDVSDLHIEAICQHLAASIA